ncbi:MAG TPA: hypothetical protein VH436_32290 [Vicinamibacterales bacterium]
MIADYRSIIEALDDGHVDFVIVGAIALVLHGSARVTRDLDICYSREQANLERLARALKPFAATLRGAPDSLPFLLDAPTLKAGLNFTLQSKAGDLDLMGEIAGIGSYAAVRRASIVMPVYEREIRVLSLDGLERAKRAAGRLKDLADLAEIQEIRRLSKS